MSARTQCDPRSFSRTGPLALAGLAACLAFAPAVAAHTLSEERVLVDTDVALDDLRALALLLDLPGVETLGVLTCDGSSRADRGADLARAFLHRLGRPEIPVWAGTRSAHPPPAWRPLYDALAAHLGEPVPSRTPPPDWRAQVTGLLTSPGGKVTVLALGPLSNLADLLKEKPELAQRVAKVIWYGSLPGGRPAFNRDFDLAAAKRVGAAGIPVFRVAAAHGADPEPVFDPPLLSDLRQASGRKAEALGWLFDLPEARQRLEQGHLRIWDELAVLFLVRPEAFAEREGLRVPDPTWIRPALVHFFRGPAGIPAARDTEAFERFPMGAEAFRSDLAGLVPELIARHGPDEFRGCVLVSELHQHLGVYSLVGVKMGIRAREILEQPDHPLQVISQAGQRPPLACLNDGLQVGAGATVGLGLLQVDQPKKPRAAATFSVQARRVTLALKPSVIAAIQKDISALKARHAGFSADYYRDLRQVAIRLWLELDRTQIFEVENP